MSGGSALIGCPLPLEMRVLGALMVFQGQPAQAEMTEFSLAKMLNLPWLTVANAVDRLVADGVAVRVRQHFDAASRIALADEFTRDVAGCPRMGKVVAFPSGDAAGSVDRAMTEAPPARLFPTCYLEDGLR